MGGGISLNPTSLDLTSFDKVINPAQLIHLKDINPKVDEKTIKEAYAQFQRYKRIKQTESNATDMYFNTKRKKAMDEAWSKANVIKLSYYAGDAVRGKSGLTGSVLEASDSGMTVMWENNTSTYVNDSNIAQVMSVSQY